MQTTDTFQVSTKVNQITWNEHVDNLKGLCFHLYEWSQFSSAKYNSTPLYFQLLDDAGVPCSLAFGHLTAKKITRITLIKRLSLTSLPASRDRDTLKMMLEQIIAYCTQQGIGSLEIGSFGTPIWSEILGELGFSLKDRWEFLLDIDMPEEELWMKFNTKKRNKIKKGQRAGLRIIRANSIEHISQFRDLALATQQRKEKRSIAFPVSDYRTYNLLKEKLMDLGLGRLYLAYDGDTPVAGAFLAGHKRSAYYMLSSANGQGLEKAAPDLLLWTAIKDYQKDGFKLFNFGGVSLGELAGEPLEKSGLYTFKKTFAAKVFPCHKGIHVLRPRSLHLFKVIQSAKTFLLR